MSQGLGVPPQTPTSPPAPRRVLGGPRAPAHWGPPGRGLRYQPGLGGRQLRLSVAAGTAPGTLTSVFGALEGRLEPGERCGVKVGGVKVGGVRRGGARRGGGTERRIRPARGAATGRIHGGCGQLGCGRLGVWSVFGCGQSGVWLEAWDRGGGVKPEVVLL